MIVDQGMRASPLHPRLEHEKVRGSLNIGVHYICEPPALSAVACVAAAVACVAAAAACVAAAAACVAAAVACVAAAVACVAAAVACVAAYIYISAVDECR
jgi:hypothetical protein